MDRVERNALNRARYHSKMIMGRFEYNALARARYHLRKVPRACVVCKVQFISRMGQNVCSETCRISRDQERIHRAAELIKEKTRTAAKPKKVCVVCKTAFATNHPRKILCGKQECTKSNQRQYAHDQHVALMKSDPEKIRNAGRQQRKRNPEKFRTRERNRSLELRVALAIVSKINGSAKSSERALISRKGMPRPSNAEHHRQYYLEHREEFLRRAKISRQANKQRDQERHRQYYSENREVLLSLGGIKRSEAIAALKAVKQLHKRDEQGDVK